MSIAKKIIDALNKGLINIYEKEKEAHPRIVGVYHPSSIGDCFRKQYYEFYEEIRPSEEKLTIFATGKGIHATIVEILKESNIVNVESYETETSLDFGEIKLHGRVDIIVAETNNEKVIIEAKTVSKPVKEPIEKHILQLQCYLHALNVNKGIILYWNKRKGEKYVFEVDKDDKYLKILKERAFSLHNYILNKKEPFKEMALKEKYLECLYCEFKEICKPLRNEIITSDQIVVFEIDNVLLNVNKKKEICLKELNLDINTKIENLSKDLKNNFFDLFYNEKYLDFDEPINENIEKAIKHYMENKSIVIISNRPQKLKEATKKQLIDLGIPFDALFLRKENMKGYEFKKTILKLLQISQYKIIDIYDELKTVEKLKKELNLFS